VVVLKLEYDKPICFSLSFLPDTGYRTEIVSTFKIGVYKIEILARTGDLFFEKP